MTPAFPDAIDATMRADFVACPRRWELAHLHGWRYPVDNVHLNIGGAYAAGLEASRKAYWGDRVSSEEALIAGLTALWQHVDPAVEDTDKKNWYTASKALIAYFAHFGWDTDPVQPYIGVEGPAVEFSFALPLPIANPSTGAPLLYAGRFDFFGVYQDSLFVVDDKTTSRLGASWTKQWNHRGQFTGYCWGAREYGLPPAGAIIRGCCFYANERLDFAQSLQYRYDWEIDRWYQQMLRDVQRMVSMYEEGYFDYNLSDSCSDYGGCVFDEACKSRTPIRLLEHTMVQRRWNPLAKELDHEAG